MPEPDLVDRESDAPLEDVPNQPPAHHPNDLNNPIQLIEHLIQVIGGAKIGRTVFDGYASRYKLRDQLGGALFFVFLFIAWVIDMGVALALAAIVIVLLIGLVYAVLRGLDAVSPVVSFFQWLVTTLKI